MKNKPAKIAYTPEFIGDKYNLVDYIIFVGSSILAIIVALLFAYGLACELGLINFGPVI